MRAKVSFVIRRPLVLALLVALLTLVACAGGAAPTPTPEPPTPTEAAAPPTPTEAAPPTPTEAARPTPTEEAEPEKRTDNLEGETITLYHFGDISGPYAAITTPLVDGFNDAVAWLNEQGGIRGAKVEVVWADDAGNIEEAISIYNRFRAADPKPIMLIIYGSPELEALRERFVEDQIVTLTAGVSGEGLYVNSGWAFGWVPIYSDQFGLFVDWLVENWE
ncbi:MAG: ABC transporter substrate-binding protein [Ardenticatenia bacterium]|nr:ABC transporter substrate-binding protein [Ardenticatenia bacterium]